MSPLSEGAPELSEPGLWVRGPGECGLGLRVTGEWTGIRRDSSKRFFVWLAWQMVSSVPSNDTDLGVVPPG